MKKLYFLIYLILGFSIFSNSRPIMASTLFAPDSDSALLFEIVTNTSSQINELERLITNAEKYTGIMEKYNQIAKDQYFRAERINYIAQNYVDLSKSNPKDLEALNSAIRGLKSETESLKGLINEYRKDEAKNELDESLISNKNKATNNELRFANSQVMRSGEVSSTNEAQKVIAQNSALNYKAQVENNQLSEVLAQKLSEQNKLLNREYKDASLKRDDRDAYYKMPRRLNQKGIN